jgi:hypothetical protein
MNSAAGTPTSERACPSVFYSELRDSKCRRTSPRLRGNAATGGITAGSALPATAASHGGICVAAHNSRGLADATEGDLDDILPE